MYVTAPMHTCMCVHICVHIPIVRACMHMYMYTRVQTHIHVNHRSEPLWPIRGPGSGPATSEGEQIGTQRVPETFSVLPLIHYVALRNSL